MDIKTFSGPPVGWATDRWVGRDRIVAQALASPAMGFRGTTQTAGKTREA
jgi:hypothetical protein